MNYNTLCLSGGGLLGLSFLGAIDILEKNNILQNNIITHFIGTSIGSILSFFIVLDIQLKKLNNLV